MKFEKHVLDAINKLEKKNHAAYAAAWCVAEATNGGDPKDWNIITDAPFDELIEIFDEAEDVDEESEILRICFDIESKDSEGDVLICDIASYKGDPSDEVAQYGFTVLAVAENPERERIDPESGFDDINAKVVRTIGSPDNVFKEDPYMMLEALSIASHVGFDLDRELFQAIADNRELLLHLDAETLRDEIERILTGKFTGKALNMMAATGLITLIYGERNVKKMSAREQRDFLTLCKNIDKTMPIPLRRLGLIYDVLATKKAERAIQEFGFDPESERLLISGIRYSADIATLNNTSAIKEFIYDHGMEEYDFIHDLSKATRIVYDLDPLKIHTRNSLLKGIMERREAIFVKDLCIDENDVMDAGITDDPSEAMKLLDMTMTKVHDDPTKNNKDELLKLASKYKKHPLRGKTAKYDWIR